MGAPFTRDLEQIRNPPIAHHRESLERERWSSAVAHEALATEIVVGREAHGTVNIEPIARCRAVAAREIVLERIYHIFRERRCVRALRVREKGGEVLAHDAVKHGVMRPAWDVLHRRGKGRTRK